MNRTDWRLLQGVTALDFEFAELCARLDKPSLADTTFRWALLVSREIGFGHTCLYPLERAGENIPLTASGEPLAFPDRAEWEKFAAESEVLGKPGEYKMLINDSGKLYLHRYHTCETELAAALRAFAAEKAVHDAGTSAYDLITQIFPDTKSSHQRQAASSVLSRRLTVLSGGPGTGKTTTVVRLLYLLLVFNPRMRIAMAAPTGKAAARLSEALRQALLFLQNEIQGLNPEIVDILSRFEGQTIHKLLRAQGNTGTFLIGPDNPLPHDAVIVDECSMLDIALTNQLVQSLNPYASLILLGDRDQLSSVEAGSVFADICEAASAGAFPDSTMITLTESRRFAAHPGIGALAAAVNCASDNDFRPFRDIFSKYSNELLWIDLPEPAHLEKILRNEIINGYLPCLEALRSDAQAAALKALEGLRILCATRHGSYGVEAMNRLCRRVLYREGLLHSADRLCDGVPVMVTRNNYSQGLFNGDVGIIHGGQACFPSGTEGDVRRIPTALLPDYEPVFAMTIHKSQGSEFDRVLIMLSHDGERVLTRQLLYTGITRARAQVIVCGTEEVFCKTTAASAKRASGLTERF